MVPAPGDTEPPMRLELRVDAQEIDLGEPEDGGVLRLWGTCLNAIRSARSGADPVTRSPYGLPVEVTEVTRYRKVIGHLAVVMRVPEIEQHVPNDDLDPALGDDARILRIALMRGQAELVVNTVDWIERDPGLGEDWLAVYKSADEFDQQYAEAEPPAHDDWVMDGSSSESSKIIRWTRRQVKRSINDLLNPRAEDVESAPTRISLSTGTLSRRLGGTMLPVQVPVLAAGGSEDSRAGRRRAKSGPKWAVDAEPPRLVGTGPDGRQMQEIQFRASGPEPVARVKLSVSLLGGDEGLHEAVPPDQLETSWTDASGIGQDSAEVVIGRTASVRFVGAPRRALRVELSAGAVDGRS